MMKFMLMRVPGADEDKEDDDDRVPAADDVPEDRSIQMKMKLVLNMDHLKKKMMRMISMLTILMEEYACRREVH